MSESLFSQSWNDASEEDVSYTRMSILALISLFFGIGSFLIYCSFWFGFIGLIGIVIALLAIILIRRSEGTVTGIVTAQTGLCLSLVSLISVALFWPCYQYGVQREADQFFRIWFAAAQNDNMPLAKGLTSPYWERPGVDDQEKWWKEQYANKFAHQSIHNYVENRLTRTMFSFGKNAKVSYYKTLSATSAGDRDDVVNVYAVSVPSEKGNPETFFVKMSGERSYPKGDVKSAGWKLTKEPEFYLPPEFETIAKNPDKALPTPKPKSH